MNPLNLSPAALLFWGSVIRHILTAIGSVLVAHGYVTQTGATAYEEELVGLIINGAVLAWSNRVAYWQRMKLLVALMMPKGSTENEVTAHIESGLPLPSVTTPPSTAPGVPDLGSVDPKRFTGTAAILLACALAAATMPACAATRPPAGTYSAVGLKAFNADETLKAITALSETAINLNRTPGQLHLKDRDTALIRDFALSAGAGLVAYGNGQGSLDIVVSAFRELSAKLSAEAVLNDKLRFVLALVADNINRIGGK